METFLTVIIAGVLIATFWTFIFMIDELFLNSIIMDFCICFIDKFIEMVTYLIRKIKGE